MSVMFLSACIVDVCCLNPNCLVLDVCVMLRWCMRRCVTSFSSVLPNMGKSPMGRKEDILEWSVLLGLGIILTMACFQDLGNMARNRHRFMRSVIIWGRERVKWYMMSDVRWSAPGDLAGFIFLRMLRISFWVKGGSSVVSGGCCVCVRRECCAGVSAVSSGNNLLRNVVAVSCVVEVYTPGEVSIVEGGWAGGPVLINRFVIDQTSSLPCLVQNSLKCSVDVFFILVAYSILSASLMTRAASIGRFLLFSLVISWWLSITFFFMALSSSVHQGGREGRRPALGK